MDEPRVPTLGGVVEGTRGACLAGVERVCQARPDTMYKVANEEGVSAATASVTATTPTTLLPRRCRAPLLLLWPLAR